MAIDERLALEAVDWPSATFKRAGTDDAADTLNAVDQPLAKESLSELQVGSQRHHDGVAGAGAPSDLENLLARVYEQYPMSGDISGLSRRPDEELYEQYPMPSVGALGGEVDGFAGYPGRRIAVDMPGSVDAGRTGSNRLGGLSAGRPPTGGPALLPGLLVGAAKVAAAAGRAEPAARLFGAGDVARAAAPMLHRQGRWMLYEHRYAEAVEVATAAIGEDAFAAAWADGQAMTPDGAVSDALELLASLQS